MQWNKIQYEKLKYNTIQPYSTNKHAHNMTLPLIVHFNFQQTNPIMSQAVRPSAPASQALSTVPLHVAPPEVAEFPKMPAEMKENPSQEIGISRCFPQSGMSKSPIFIW